MDGQHFLPSFVSDEEAVQFGKFVMQEDTIVDLKCYMYGLNKNYRAFYEICGSKVNSVSFERLFREEMIDSTLSYTPNIAGLFFFLVSSVGEPIDIKRISRLRKETHSLSPDVMKRISEKNLGYLREFYCELWMNEEAVQLAMEWLKTKPLYLLTKYTMWAEHKNFMAFLECLEFTQIEYLCWRGGIVIQDLSQQTQELEAVLPKTYVTKMYLYDIWGRLVNIRDRELVAILANNEKVNHVRTILKTLLLTTSLDGNIVWGLAPYLDKVGYN